MIHKKYKIGIYRILTKHNNKIYIGSSKNIHMRWHKHRYELRKNIHSNKHMLNVYNKYGEEDFEFSIIEEVENISLSTEREQHYIDLYKCYDKNVGYNKRKKAETNLGVVCSEVTREKHRINSLGKKHSEETKKIISEKNKGKIFSEETRKKMSLAKKGKSNHWKGKKRSESQRKFLSELAKQRTGVKNSNSKLTEEQVEEIKNMHKQKIKINDIAKQFSVSRSSIKRIIYNITYKRKSIEENK